MAEAAPEVVVEGAVRVLAEAGEVGYVHVPLCERGQHSEAKGHSASWQPLEAVCAALNLRQYRCRRRCRCRSRRHCWR